MIICYLDNFTVCVAVLAVKCVQNKKSPTFIQIESLEVNTQQQSIYNPSITTDCNVRASEMFEKISVELVEQYLSNAQQMRNLGEISPLVEKS